MFGGTSPMSGTSLVAEASPPSIIGRLVDTEKCRVGDGVGFLKESLHRAVSGRHFFFFPSEEGWGAELKERREKFLEAKTQVKKKISKERRVLFILENPDAWHDRNSCH
jgi:hypothetical protein